MRKLLISAENAEYQIIESLKLNRAKRAEHHEIFIEGIEPIKKALEAGVEITRIITAPGNLSDWAKGVIADLSQADTSAADLPQTGTGTVGKLIEMADSLYRKLCDRREPSEMLVTAKMQAPKLREIVLGEKPFILLLDRPGDPGNLGSIIRSANSFQVDEVLIIGHGTDPWDPKTIRASLGSVFFTTPIQVESLDELEEFIREQKERSGLTVWGTDSTGAVSLAGGKIKRPIMLAMGNEAKGISRALKDLCDEVISIPIGGKVNSLNIASAASIFMWEVFKNSGSG
jgi:TrmH family RNA methyltransferase